MIELPSGHEASSGCRASSKKRTNFTRRPDCNPEPRTVVGQNALTVLADYAGGRILRSNRSNVHLNMPPGFESYGLPSESHTRSGENHEDGSREPLLESGHLGNQSKLKKMQRKLDSINQPSSESHMKSGKNHEDGSREPLIESGHLGNQNKLKELKRKLDSITQPPSESHMRSGKSHEDGSREPFLESGCLGNQTKLKKLKRKLDSITQPLHTKARLQIASGSRPVTRRSSNVINGCVSLLKQKSGTDCGRKSPRREEGHNNGSGVPPMNSEHTTSSASSDSSLQHIPSGIPCTRLQNPFTSSPSSPQSQPICSTPQPTIPPVLPPSNQQPRDIPSYFGSRRSTSAACSKRLISPDGTGFYPNPTEVVHCITSIIQHNFDGPWPTWKKIPINVRDQWFEKFQKRYDWQPEHAHQVRLNFEARGMTRLSDIFRMVRKKVNVRPLWLSSEVWDGLKQYWDSPEFKLISEQAKINRASDCDGLGPSKHTCGAIPMSEHKRRLEEKTGEEVTPIELFVHTHQRRRDKTWVDSKSAQAYEKFMEEWNKLHSSQPATQLSGSEGEGQTSAQPTQPADPKLAETELWIKTNLTNRGRIYGLGSEAVKYKTFGSSNPSTSEPIHRTTPNWFDTPEFQQLLSQKVTEVSSEWNAQLEQERRDTEELRKRVAELEREKLEKKKRKKAKKKLNQMKEMMEMLQKQYESLSKGQPSSDDDDDDDVDGSSDSDY